MEFSRWQNFSKHDQLLHIGAEILRAAGYQKQNQEKFRFFLARAIELIELTDQDPKWKNFIVSPSAIKSELEKFRRGEKTEDIKILYQAL